MFNGDAGQVPRFFQAEFPRLHAKSNYGENVCQHPSQKSFQFFSLPERMCLHLMCKPLHMDWPPQCTHCLMPDWRRRMPDESACKLQTTPNVRNMLPTQVYLNKPPLLQMPSMILGDAIVIGHASPSAFGLFSGQMLDVPVHTAAPEQGLLADAGRHVVPWGRRVVPLQHAPPNTHGLGSTKHDPFA